MSVNIFPRRLTQPETGWLVDHSKAIETAQSKALQQATVNDLHKAREVMLINLQYIYVTLFRN